MSWRAPTSTGGGKLTAFVVLVREGAEGEFKERTTLDASAADSAEQKALASTRRTLARLESRQASLQQHLQ